MIRANRPKYGNKKITIPSGEVFDSKREYQRWLILKEAETKGNNIRFGASADI